MAEADNRYGKRKVDPEEPAKLADVVTVSRMVAVPCVSRVPVLCVGGMVIVLGVGVMTVVFCVDVMAVVCSMHTGKIYPRGVCPQEGRLVDFATIPPLNEYPGRVQRSTTSRGDPMCNPALMGLGLVDENHVCTCGTTDHLSRPVAVEDVRAAEG